MCYELAKYRYIWPGSDEFVICEGHVGKLRGLAEAMSLHLQIIQLSEKDLELGFPCNQKDG